MRKWILFNEAIIGKRLLGREMCKMNDIASARGGWFDLAPVIRLTFGENAVNKSIPRIKIVMQIYHSMEPIDRDKWWNPRDVKILKLRIIDNFFLSIYIALLWIDHIVVWIFIRSQKKWECSMIIDASIFLLSRKIFTRSGEMN